MKLSTITPFEIWCLIPRTESEKQLYWDIKNEMEEIATNGSIKSITSIQSPKENIITNGQA